MAIRKHVDAEQVILTQMLSKENKTIARGPFV
jgi:hypothetical protein